MYCVLIAQCARAPRLRGGMLCPPYVLNRLSRQPRKVISAAAGRTLWWPGAAGEVPDAIAYLAGHLHRLDHRRVHSRAVGCGPVLLFVAPAERCRRVRRPVDRIQDGLAARQSAAYRTAARAPFRRSAPPMHGDEERGATWCAKRVEKATPGISAALAV